MKKFFKKDTPLGLDEQNKNRRRSMKFNERISTIGRNMSRGAANIFKIIRTRCKWGNKQLWGTREGGKPRMPLDKSSKQKK
ncbi:MAG: hypothetical protein WDZ41_00315 [Candidatus Babeliales bacterium]